MQEAIASFHTRPLLASQGVDNPLAVRAAEAERAGGRRQDRRCGVVLEGRRGDVENLTVANMFKEAGIHPKEISKLLSAAAGAC